MDAKTIGLTIAGLRNKNKLTQSALAAKLNVSDKAVSKWENGLGYPEITLFPALASIFGVSIDYLMNGERKGIAVAGNILLDIVKSINCYPQKGMLARITSIVRSVGGCAPNTAVNLSEIERSIPLAVIGRIGDDEHGRYLLSQLQKHNIDTSGISISATAPTSFCDVMSLPTGERTFFHAKGANAEFGPEDIDFSALNCNILHIGYILLLDKFDREDEEYGTVMARFLHQIQEQGIKTSIDVVSDSTADYGAKILAALPYCNYVIINETECCKIFDVSSREEDGSLNQAAIETSMRRMIEAGVRDKVIIHSKECSFCLSSDGAFTMLPSLNIPESEIKGSVGAGDAFCAGCLYGIYHRYSDPEILKFASSAAACSLFAENSVDGMRSKGEIIKMQQKYGRISL